MRNIREDVANGSLAEQQAFCISGPLELIKSQLVVALKPSGENRVAPSCDPNELVAILTGNKTIVRVGTKIAFVPKSSLVLESMKGFVLIMPLDYFGSPSVLWIIEYPFANQEI